MIGGILLLGIVTSSAYFKHGNLLTIAEIKISH
jgi:hypothetical protein